jgi:hypothetical protein
MQVVRDIIVGLHYFFGAQVSHMALKRPKQGKAVAPFKPREMLDLTELSASAAEKFREAMQQVAGKVRYTGSPYHRSSAKEGPVAQRIGVASRCPPNWINLEATRLLRNAILEGRVSTHWEQGFPRHVWHLDEDVLYEARLTNAGNGEYHGYPLEDRWQWPKNFK